MTFLGTHADLGGQQIGAFRVVELAGRDAAGAPRWRIVCDGCHYPQTLPHSRIALLVQGRHSQITLLCANPACPQSHREHESETIDEFRRRERREAEQAASAAAEAQRADQASAAKEQADCARSAEIQRQYIQYLNHQWRAGQDDDKICPISKWFALQPGTRRIVNDLIAKDPGAKISGF